MWREEGKGVVEWGICSVQCVFHVVKAPVWRF